MVPVEYVAIAALAVYGMWATWWMRRFRSWWIAELDEHAPNQASALDLPHTELVPDRGRERCH